MRTLLLLLPGPLQALLVHSSAGLHPAGCRWLPCMPQVTSSYYNPRYLHSVGDVQFKNLSHPPDISGEMPLLTKH